VRALIEFVGQIGCALIDVPGSIAQAAAYRNALPGTPPPGILKNAAARGRILLAGNNQLLLTLQCYRIKVATMRGRRTVETTMGTANRRLNR
jgi:hypothetical protein